MKLKDFEKLHSQNPAFHQRKFQRYWKTMMHYYENSNFEDFHSTKKSTKRRGNLLELPDDLYRLDSGEREGLIGGIRIIASVSIPLIPFKL